MTVVVAEEPVGTLADYAEVSIAFEVSSVFDLTAPPHRPGDPVLTERRLDRPYRKDYDAIPGNLPADWARRFEVSRWARFSARLDGRPVGGAIVAFDTPGLLLLEGRRDLALLWDLRVSLEARRQGVGRSLFDAAVRWAAAHCCRELKVETQNINVPACRFYARQGRRLQALRLDAYPDFPDEVQLLWSKPVAVAAPAG